MLDVSGDNVEVHEFFFQTGTDQKAATMSESSWKQKPKSSNKSQKAKNNKKRKHHCPGRAPSASRDENTSIGGSGCPSQQIRYVLSCKSRRELTTKGRNPPDFFRNSAEFPVVGSARGDSLRILKRRANSD